MDKITCLHDRHVALGANMVPFGGFDMPLYYSDITTEHNAVRQNVGVFDVSHMGEVSVTGEEAERYVQHIFTNDIKGATIGSVFYGMMLYPNGGTVDDLLVYKNGEQDFLLVINAANIDKDYAWIEEQAEGFNVATKNLSESYGQLAIQGPEAEEIVGSVLGLECKDLAFYTFKTLDNNEVPAILSRTGYTGEDGFELYGNHDFIIECWDKLIAAGVQPCGLGCRDTLRFEVGLPLYGDELSPEISPVMSGLSMFVKLDKEEFIGKEACAKQKAEGVEKKVVGIELASRAIPRHGYEVEKDGKVVGEETELSNSLLNKRFHKIIYNEMHSIDTSVETLRMLQLIVFNTNAMLNRGINLDGIIRLGQFLRGKGDKVDFLKLEKWLSSLHLQRMAQLQGSILIAVFGFGKDEIDFVKKEEPVAYKLTIKIISNLVKDTVGEWHFRQNAAGFVQNNGKMLRRNLRRSYKYMRYAPLETTSNFINGFIKGLSEIEE